MTNMNAIVLDVLWKINVPQITHQQIQLLLQNKCLKVSDCDKLWKYVTLSYQETQQKYPMSCDLHMYDLTMFNFVLCSIICSTFIIYYVIENKENKQTNEKWKCVIIWLYLVWCRYEGNITSDIQPTTEKPSQRLLLMLVFLRGFFYHTIFNIFMWRNAY